MNRKEVRKLLNSFIGRANATNDQEIAAGAEWLETNDPAHTIDFNRRLNDACDNPQILRDMSDDELSLVRNFAMIGWHQVFFGKAAT